MPMPHPAPAALAGKEAQADPYAEYFLSALPRKNHPTSESYSGPVSSTTNLHYPRASRKPVVRMAEEA
jgi:hypothetical protein